MLPMLPLLLRWGEPDYLRSMDGSLGLARYLTDGGNTLIFGKDGCEPVEMAWRGAVASRMVGRVISCRYSFYLPAKSGPFVEEVRQSPMAYILFNCKPPSPLTRVSYI
jgi:hypothetical protein